MLALNQLTLSFAPASFAPMSASRASAVRMEAVVQEPPAPPPLPKYVRSPCPLRSRAYAKRICDR